MTNNYSLCKDKVIIKINNITATRKIKMLKMTKDKFTIIMIIIKIIILIILIALM